MKYMLLTYLNEKTWLEMTPEQQKMIVTGMWTAVSGGTARVVNMPGFDVAAKTGTAQAAGALKGEKDHAWIVTFAPAYDPEIAVIGLIENVGFGGTHAGPPVRAMYETYLAKNHPNLAPETETAAR